MRTARSLAFALHAAALAPLALGSGCGGTPAATAMDMSLPPTQSSSLVTTLMDLAGFGEKHVGTAPGASAASYLIGRFQSLGLDDPRMESWSFPRHDVMSSSVRVSIDGVDQRFGFDVFEGCGSGNASGEVVFVGYAQPADLMGKDLTGKIAMVQRTNSYHRSSQFRNVAAAGASAMLYASIAPDNLRQVGSVRLTFESQGPIPAITIGQDDGTAITNALTAGKTVTANIAVQVTSTPATGSNVVARIAGREAGEIVIGAHYDSWFVGSSDNGGGIAALLALAARRKQEAQPRYTLVFVAYDGEEVALYGGYDFLRRHKIVGQEPIVAVLNFEVPSAKGTTLNGLARSNQEPLDDALKGAGLSSTYQIYAAMDVVPKLFGGIIPTDIQGIYRNGTPTVSTAVDAPYYHTTEDTPDKVDADFLAGSVDEFDAALDTLLADDRARFQEPDPKLWLATVATATRAASDPLVLDVLVTDSTGAPQADAPVASELLVDDFTQAATATAQTGADGHATITYAASDVAKGSGHRYAHVTSGPEWPLVEQVIALP